MSICPPLAEAKTVIPFKGEIDFSAKKFLMTFDNGAGSSLSVEALQAQENQYTISVNITSLRTPFFDISTILESTWEVRRVGKKGPPTITGKVGSQYSLINYKPVQELAGQFEIKDGKFFIHSLSVGNVLCQGSIQTIVPYQMDVKVRLAGVDMNDFLFFFLGKHDIVNEGMVGGEIHVFGKPDHLQLKGQLASYEGFVDQLDYSSIKINTEGVYPLIYVSDSTITQSDGLTYGIAGTLDLSRKEDLGRQIGDFITEPLVKAEGTSWEWTLKKVKSENRSGTTELKYLLHKNDHLHRSPVEDSDMFGLERKMEF
jgi:hypothetical protein